MLVELQERKKVYPVTKEELDELDAMKITSLGSNASDDQNFQLNRIKCNHKQATSASQYGREGELLHMQKYFDIA